MTRNHGWFLLVCLLTGCSTHPLANTLDFFCPGKLGPNRVQPYGGVGIPQGAVLAPVSGTTIGGPLPLDPAAGSVPPPVVVPGNRPPAAFQLQPPTFPDSVPLPPEPPRKF
jgi:hypothetical protein